MNIAFITGISGQDGSYLAELLLSKEYHVVGLVRHSSNENVNVNIKHIINNPNLVLFKGDISDILSLQRIMTYIESYVEKNNINTIHIYNLAAQSFVELSFHIPDTTLKYDAMGVLNLLECVRHSKYKNIIRFYQASSSEMFGKVVETPQIETTPFYPRSPYGCAKVFAYWLCKNYRESYNLFICNGILFNHESPRRGKDFVTRKISLGVAKIAKGDKTPINLGNLDSIRDWGHSKDYVYGMYLLMNHSEPDDWVISSNEVHSVREFIEKSFKYVNINIEWHNSGIDEVGINPENNQILIKINSAFLRPAEVDLLHGNSEKIRRILNWEPSYSFDNLVAEMVQNDLDNYI